MGGDIYYVFLSIGFNTKKTMVGILCRENATEILLIKELIFLFV
jgi:hypothetical protein